MNIEKLKSGSYRIRQMYNGKKYSITIDHKPTQKEAVQLMAELLDNEVDYNYMTFKSACSEYIKIKNNVLSPTTIRGYTCITKSFSNRFLSLQVNSITQADVQKEINDYAKNHTPKSVANMHGFLSAVIKEFRPNFNLFTKLPQKEQNKDGYIPNSNDIERLLEYVKGKPHELGIKLAVCGLRRSEICALEPSDLETDSDILHINKAYVKGVDGWSVKRTNKSDSGTRNILLPQEFATLYRTTKPNKENHVYNYMPDTLYKALCRYEKELGIEHFKLHACRHFYASKLHEEGVPDSIIMAMGGWKSDNVMKNVYRHALTDTQKEMMQKSADIINNLL